MGFQKVVGMTPAIGFPGQEVNPGQAIYSAFNYVSDGTAKAGEFVFAKTLEDGETAVNQASAKGTGKPIGIVERVLIGSINNPMKENADTYPLGLGLAIAIRGQYYMVATGEATEGQAVHCDPSNGEVTYGNAGEANDTGWVVRLPAGVKTVAEGDLIIVEKF